MEMENCQKFSLKNVMFLKIPVTYIFLNFNFFSSEMCQRLKMNLNQYLRQGCQTGNGKLPEIVPKNYQDVSKISWNSHFLKFQFFFFFTITKHFLRNFSRTSKNLRASQKFSKPSPIYSNNNTLKYSWNLENIRHQGLFH